MIFIPNVFIGRWRYAVYCFKNRTCVLFNNFFHDMECPEKGCPQNVFGVVCGANVNNLEIIYYVNRKEKQEA